MTLVFLGACHTININEESILCVGVIYACMLSFYMPTYSASSSWKVTFLHYPKKV